MEGLARRWWEGDVGPWATALALIGVPLSWAWAAVNALRDLRFAVAPGERVQGLKVVSVGNLAVGGTGKTPVSAWVARWLADAGTSTSVLVGEAGRDEAELHRRWNPDVPVLVGRDRLRRALEARDSGAGVVVLDDGFQHRRLARDLDLVLMSAEDRVPVRLLPLGPYRESRRALARASRVLVTRREATETASRALAVEIERGRPGLVCGGVHLVPGGWRRLDGEVAAPPCGDALAVCGVARARLFRSVAAGLLGGSVELVAFGDHHRYRDAEVAQLRKVARDRPIVTTRKDAIKLAEYAGILGDTYVLEERLEWDWGREETLALFAGLARSARVG